MRRKRIVNPFAMLLVVVSCSASCAIGNKDRRRLLNYLDDNWVPATTTGRWLAAPVALPVGFVAGVTDAALLHPLSQIDDAWIDTVDVVWDFGDSTDFRTVLLTPLSAVATPVIFGVTWLWRSVFDIDDSDGGGDASDDAPDVADESTRPSDGAQAEEGK